MMATDNIAGHTAAQNTLGEDGLRDGDSLSPTTLTNLIQGVQGNGILRYQDSAYGSSRNETNSGNQPGSMVRATASTLTVSGGFAVLDGAVYEFGTGVGNTITLDLNNGSHGTGALTLAANQEAIYTIYVAPAGGLNKVKYEGGSPVDTTTGLYPSASNQYLIDYDGSSTQDNMKAIVLAQVRVQYIGSGGGSNNLNIVEINDKRVFVKPSADYRVPLSTGTISAGKVSDGGGEGVNTIADFNLLHNENGEITPTADTITAHWVSHPQYAAFDQAAATSGQPGFGSGPSRGTDLSGNHVRNALYFAGRNNEGTSHYSVRLDGQGVEGSMTEITGSITKTITSHGDSFIMLKVATGQTVTLNPERDASANYKFPEGHIIEVCNEGVAGKGNIVFDNQTSPSGVNATLTPGDRATFVYEGSKWMSCNYPIAGGGVTDGDKGDITVSSGGNTWTIDNDAVTYAKIQDVSQTNVFLGRDSAGAGIIEEIDATAARAILNVADGATANAGTVTSVTGTLPISSTGGATPAISIAAASGSDAGSMSAAHFNKLNALTQYTDLQARTAVASNNLVMNNGLQFRASTSIVDAPLNQVGPNDFELILDEAGTVLLAPGGATIGLPNPATSSIGDTYVVINTDTGLGAGTPVTIDRSGMAAFAPLTHGTAQQLNGGTANGSLPAHEAVTIIYTGNPAFPPGAGWYAIGL